MPYTVDFDMLYAKYVPSLFEREREPLQHKTNCMFVRGVEVGLGVQGCSSRATPERSGPAEEEQCGEMCCTKPEKLQR